MSEKIETGKKNSIGTLVVGVLSLQLIQQISFAMAPAFADFAKYWPDIPYSRILMLQTFGYLCIIPTSIIGGAIAGSKIKYKTLSLISIYIFSGSFILLDKGFASFNISSIVLFSMNSPLFFSKFSKVCFFS